MLEQRLRGQGVAAAHILEIFFFFSWAKYLGISQNCLLLKSSQH